MSGVSTFITSRWDYRGEEEGTISVVLGVLATSRMEYIYVCLPAELFMIQITGIIVRKMVLLLNYRARGACIASPDRPPLAWSPPTGSLGGTYGTVGTIGSLLRYRRYLLVPGICGKGPRAARLDIHGQ